MDSNSMYIVCPHIILQLPLTSRTDVYIKPGSTADISVSYKLREVDFNIGPNRVVPSNLLDGVDIEIHCYGCRRTYVVYSPNFPGFEKREQPKVEAWEIKQRGKLTV